MVCLTWLKEPGCSMAATVDLLNQQHRGAAAATHSTRRHVPHRDHHRRIPVSHPTGDDLLQTSPHTGPRV